MKVTEQDIRSANAAGIKHIKTGDFWSYYTPVLQVAYNLGQSGVDLSNAPVVSGWRAGKAPESYISHNWRDGISEPGLSMMAVNGGGEHWSAAFVGARKKYEYAGILSGTGSDDEPCILSLEAENLD